jgi:hypothetical protein
MNHLLSAKETCPGRTYSDDFRLTRTADPTDCYRGRNRTKPIRVRARRILKKRIRVRARRILKRTNDFFKSMFKAVAAAKLRCVERELELRGVRYDHHQNEWTLMSSS